MLDETGLIKKVTLWLLDEAAIMYQHFAEQGCTDMRLSINLTARMMQDDAFSSKLLKHLMENKSDPENLVVELTEDALAEYFDGANETLQVLRILGAKVAIDDFGTGESLLDHLRSFQFDQVKIDKSYVQGINEDAGDTNQVTAIIQMGHSFGMQVVAEGVETIEQLEFLQQHDSDLMQGYLISKPVPAEQVIEIVEYHVQQQALPLDVMA